MSDVPSNLIPTRITQLPTAPVADENSLMMIVYQGNNYQIRVGDLLSVAGVPTSTQVIAGTGMTGGGALTGNVTLSIAPGGVGSAQLASSGVTPGVYGDSTNIPVFTVDDTGRVMAASSIPVSVSGYVPESRQVIAGDGLNGGGTLNANVTLAANLSNATPLAGDGAGTPGSSLDISRADHQHPAVNLGVDAEVDGILGLSNGGTAKSLVPDAGAIIWCGADGLYVGPVGASGQVLVSSGTGEYTWGSALLVVDQPANVVYAGPTAGPDAPTAFRALVNADLPASGIIANTYGSPAEIPVLTVNSKGVITSVTTATPSIVSLPWSSITGTPTTLSGYGVSSVPWSYVTGSPTTLTGYGITDGATSGANSNITSLSGLTTALSVPQGGTGVVTLTGYVKGSGAVALTASSTIPNTDITGLGTMSVQNAGSVAITGGSVNATSVGNITPSTGAFTSIATTTGTITTAPSGNADIVNKAYVDLMSSTNLSIHTPVRLESPNTVGNLTATYVNGGTTPTWTDITGGTTLTTGSAHNLNVNDVIVFGSTTNGITAGTPYFVYSTPTATDITLSLTYNGVEITTLTNGTGLTITSLANAGVGATLTNAGVKAALTIDGKLTVVGNRVLIYSQTNAFENGVYTVTTVGTPDPAGTNWVLTRATDSDTYAPNSTVSLGQGDYFFVQEGDTGAGESYVMTTAGTIVFGTTGLTFTQFGASQVYSAGAGLTLTNTTFSLTSPVSISLGGTNGTATPAAGAVSYGDGLSYAFTSVGISSQVLLSNGASAPSWSNQSSLTAGAATNLAGGIASQIPYQTGAGATSFIANGTAGQVLLSAGTGAPTWSGISGGTF